MVECCLLNCCSWVAHSAFFRNPGHLPRNSSAPVGCFPPTLISNQQNAPTDLSADQTDGDKHSIKTLSSQITPDCVKLMKTPLSTLA